MFARSLSVFFALGWLLTGCGSSSSPSPRPTPPTAPFVPDPSRPLLVGLKDKAVIHKRGVTSIEFAADKDYQHQAQKPATRIEITQQSSNIAFGPWTCAASGLCRSQLSAFSSADSSPSWFEYRVITDDAKSAPTKVNLTSGITSNLSQIQLQQEKNGNFVTLAAGPNAGYESSFQEKASWISTKNLVGFGYNSSTCDTNGICKIQLFNRSETASTFALDYKVQTATDESDWQHLEIKLPQSLITWNNKEWSEDLNDGETYRLSIVKSDKALEGQLSYQSNEIARKLVVSESSGIYASTPNCDAAGVCSVVFGLNSLVQEGTAKVSLQTEFGKSQSLPIRFQRISIRGLKKVLIVSFKGKSSITFRPNVDYSISQDGRATQINLVAQTAGITTQAIPCDNLGVCTGTLQVDTATVTGSTGTVTYDVQKGKIRSSSSTLTLQNSLTSKATRSKLYQLSQDLQTITIKPSASDGYSSALNPGAKALAIFVRNDSGIQLSSFSCDEQGICQARATPQTGRSSASFEYRIETADEISGWTQYAIELTDSRTSWVNSKLTLETKKDIELPLIVRKVSDLVSLGLNYRSDEMATRIEISNLKGLTIGAFSCETDGTCRSGAKLDASAISGSADLTVITPHGKSLPLTLTLNAQSALEANLDQVSWKENEDKVLSIGPGPGKGYTSDDGSLATQVEILGVLGLRMEPFPCDASGLCSAKVNVLDGFYQGSFSYAVINATGRSKTRTVAFSINADIRSKDIALNVPRSFLSFPITLPASSASVSGNRTVDAIEVVENNLGTLEPFVCDPVGNCSSRLQVKEGFNMNQLGTFRFRFKSGAVQSRITKVDLTFKINVEVPDQNIFAQRNGELITVFLQQDKNFRMIGLHPTTQLVAEFSNLPQGLTLYKAGCVPQQKSCIAAFKAPLDFNPSFQMTLTLRAPSPVDALFRSGTLNVTLDPAPVDHPPMIVNSNGLFPSILQEQNLAVEIRPFEHYFDQDGDFARKILLRNIQGIDVNFDSCKSDGACLVKLARKENLATNAQASFEWAVETREGSASSFTKVSMTLPKLIFLAGVKGTPVRMRLGNDTANDLTTGITTQNLKEGYFACLASNFLGCSRTWVCASGLCDGVINAGASSSRSSFNYDVTQAGKSIDLGAVQVDWQSFDEDLVQKSRVVSTAADSTVEIQLSAEPGGDITLPYGSDYILTDVRLGRIQGGEFVGTPTFTCFEQICRAKFHIAAASFGTHAAYFQYQLVAFSKSRGKTLRPRVYASVAFDVKAAPPKVRTAPEENLIVTLGGQPTDVLQDVNFSFTPEVTALKDGDRFALEAAPSWLHLDPLSGKVFGLQTESDRSEVGFTVIILRGELIIGRKAYQTTYRQDPLKEFAWHLENVGQNAFAALSGIFGADINAKETMAQGYTGRGVRVAVSDTGMEITHPDLRDNVNKSLSRNFACESEANGCDIHDPSPTDTDGDHGTSVSGLIAAKAWNGIGSRGVAPNAELIGLNFLSSQTVASSIDQYLAPARIVNQSWGRSQELSSGYFPLSTLDENAIETALRGLGTVFVKSAGNSFETYGNANFDANSTHRGMIIVGALNARGIKSSYSSIGSNLWISAPGGEYGMDRTTSSPGGEPAMITTDQTGCSKGYSQKSEKHAFGSGENPLNENCDYTSNFNGTSSAAPVTSGVIALLLEANPKLTWRDVKHILATTARKVDESFPGLHMQIAGQDYLFESPWQTNAAGYHFHNWYGFGAIDTDAALAMARHNYQFLPQETVSNWLLANIPTALAIPDGTKEGITSTMDLDQELLTETISIKVDIRHKMPGDLGLELTSPSGTKSIVLNVLNSNFSQNIDQIVFLSNAFYGENAKGTWTLRVIDGVKGVSGQLQSWSMKIQGRKNP